ncbi:MAG: Dyp-type peroxidase [Verrucomicrobiota bacterium]|nr:Dyp-type peroxidase [Verrucomicrobiota bacterium]
MGLVTSLVTSAWTQAVETAQFKQFRVPGKMFANFFLTAKGYRALGFAQDQIEQGFQEKPDELGTISNFKEGMQAHRDELNDPDPSTWDAGFREGRIDAMLLIADDDVTYLLRRAREIINELEAVATIVAVERGDALRTEQGEGIEHFGYVDGRSQPIYFKGDLKDEGNTSIWNPIEPFSRVLVSDPFGNTEDAFGSYYVFRKLEQNVLDFKIREHQLAQELGLKDEDKERAGAMAVGRFEDGTPLTLSQTDGFLPTKENDFDYSKDPDGHRCPFHAHIRKTNPRGDIIRQLVPGGDEEQLERSRRITRRGITYGERKRHPNDLPDLDDLSSKEVGLLFQCFQESIPRQFAFMQKAWVNADDFVVPGTGPDPVIGQAVPGTTPFKQEWPVEWGPQPDPANPRQTIPPARKAFSFGEFVKLKGGEFFFAPSMPFLRRLMP